MFWGISSIHFEQHNSDQIQIFLHHCNQRTIEMSGVTGTKGDNNQANHAQIH